MPDTCENKQLIDRSDIPFKSPFISRRRFVGTAVAAFIGAATYGLINPREAYAVTSAEKQAEADQVKAKLDAWEDELAQLLNNYYDACDAHDRAVANMEEAQGRIDAAVARQNEIQAELAQRARTMYKQGPLSFLDVIFGSASFVEFSTSWDLLNAVNNRDASLIRECEESRAAAEEARAEYAVQERLAEEKRIEAQEIYEEGQALAAAYRAEWDRLEAEVAELIEAERRAEEERRAREEAARRAAQQAASGSSNSGGVGGSSGYVPYNGETYSSIVDAAYSRLGCPYVWAASGPNQFDCSGLTSWCYKQVGIYIPRGGNAQYYDAPMRHSVSEAQAGDILWNYTHVGLCIGGGQFIHAPRPGDVVKISTIAGYGWLGAARWC